MAIHYGLIRFFPVFKGGRSGKCKLRSAHSDKDLYNKNNTVKQTEWEPEDSMDQLNNT